MADYCTRADLEARLGYGEVARLADADMDGQEDASALADAIADISAHITSVIARRWPAYVGVPTPILTPIACDLVAHRLARGPMASDDITARADRAERMLAAIGKGDAVPSPDEVAAADQGAGEVNIDTGRRVFGGGGF